MPRRGYFCRMESNQKKLTPISQLGEFGLIKRIAADFRHRQPSTLLGIGDDAAIIATGQGSKLWSMDLLVENIHFDLVYTPLRHLGYKSVIVNLSDICAMNGHPQQIMMGLALSSRFTVEAIDEFYAGVEQACRHYEVDLVGGDTTSSQRGMFISVSVLGEVAKGGAVRRSGARVGDLICTTGDLGGAYMGLQILEREKSVYADVPDLKPDLEQYAHILARLLKPEARQDIITLFESMEAVPTAMMDISDGLSSELFHICEASGCGAIIYEDQLPLHGETRSTAAEFAIAPSICALNGGEDYELLFTISEKEYEKIDGLKDITIIGEITAAASGIKIETDSGQQFDLKAQGWNALQ